VATGRITVYSDGRPWRPVVHVRDVARLFLAVLQAPTADIHNQVFNAGSNHLNYRVMDLARIVQQAVPECTVEVLAQPGADQRTYRADFSKFADAFPRFQFLRTAEDGARELCEAFRRMRLNREIFLDKRFTRIEWLKHLLGAGELDGSLRWRNGTHGGRRD
jgi:nucleoside-diphosphate-sugar epimerase